ncbi:MAG: P-II family nitrogen regulator [Pseudomonadota bacterium]
MKMIIAYIQSFMLEKVTDALREKHIHGVTILDCCGFGRLAEDKRPHYLDPDDRTGFVEKKKIEIVCSDEAVSEIVQTIRKSAHTGRHGDGKIFVSYMLGAVDIRTDLQGEGIL